MTDLKAARDKAADEYGANNRHLKTSQHFADGWGACIAHLSQLAGEFDNEAFLKKWGHISPSDYQLILFVANEQHLQMAARVGLAETLRNACANAVTKSNETFVLLEDRITELEAKLLKHCADPKDPTDHCPLCAKDKRIELLEQRLAEANEERLCLKDEVRLLETKARGF